MPAPSLAGAQKQTVAIDTPAPALRLVNRDPAAVHDIRVSPTGSRAWGADRPGQDVLAPGRVARTGLPAGGWPHDIRLVFADGRAVERRGADRRAASQAAFP